MTKLKIFILSTFALVSCQKDAIELPKQSSTPSISDVSNLLTSGHWILRESYFLETSNGSKIESTIDHDEEIRFNIDQSYNRVFTSVFCADSLVGLTGTWTFLSDQTQLGYVFGDSTYPQDIIQLNTDSLILGIDISPEMQNVAVFIKASQSAQWPYEHLSM